jgi:energy-coupling factor transporter transmembrane protein EcfT
MLTFFFICVVLYIVAPGAFTLLIGCFVLLALAFITPNSGKFLIVVLVLFITYHILSYLIRIYYLYKTSPDAQRTKCSFRTYYKYFFKNDKMQRGWKAGL